MPVYTVHAPSPSGADLRATDEFVFVRDGFHFWAAVSRRALAGLAPAVAGADRLDLVMAAIDVALGELGVGRLAIFLADCLLALLLGLEASSLQRWTLSRRNWRQLDVVVADDVEAAERRFFDRWSASARQRQRSISRSIAARRRRHATFRASRSRAAAIAGTAASSACFRNREDRDDRRHHRLRLGQSALRGEGVRARHAQHGGSAEDRGHARSRSGLSRRPHRAARRRRLRRLPPGAGRASMACSRR